MIKHLIILSICVGLHPMQSFAQHSLTGKNGSTEITGIATAFYSHSMLKEAFVDSTPGDFKLKDLQIQLKGKSKNWFEFELHADIIDLIDSNIYQSEPGLLAATITFKTFVDIKLGYDRLPYSKSSMLPYYEQVFWDRPTINMGGLWARRDAGITLHKALANKGNIYLGAYSGFGEYLLKNTAALGPDLEYVARFDYGLPYAEPGIVDISSSATPKIGFGLNARYSFIADVPGLVVTSDIAGPYGLKRVIGDNYSIGADLSFNYKGFSLLTELHQLSIIPLRSNHAAFQGESFTKHNGKVNSGGYFVEAHQYLSIANSILSLRYQEYNLNNLVYGVNKDIALGIAYQIDGFDAMIKAQFVHLLEEEDNNIQLWDNQIRIGAQFKF